MIITIVTCFFAKWNMNINAAYDFLILSLLCLTKLDHPEYFESSMIFFEL